MENEAHADTSLVAAGKGHVFVEDGCPVAEGINLAVEDSLPVVEGIDSVVEDRHLVAEGRQLDAQGRVSLAKDIESDTPMVSTPLEELRLDMEEHQQRNQSALHLQQIHR